MYNPSETYCKESALYSNFDTYPQQYDVSCLILLYDCPSHPPPLLQTPAQLLNKTEQNCTDATGNVYVQSEYQRHFLHVALSQASGNGHFFPVSAPALTSREKTC
jgi:hypothetical protein